MSGTEETSRCGCSRAQGCLIDTVLEHSCPFMLMGFTWEKPREGEGCLGCSSGFWRKIGAIHQTLHLTKANAGLANKGFVYEAANWETCEVQGLVRVYQSASQLLYLTSEGHRPRGPHSIFWLVGLAVFSCGRKKKGKERDEERKERGA